MSLSIVEFLNARYDELAERAKATTEADLSWLADYADDVGLRNAATLVRAFTPPDIAADIEAKRRIIREHYVIQHVRGGEAYRICSRCSDFIDRGETFRIEVAPCNTLRILALPFSNHPDYDPEWAVTE